MLFPEVADLPEGFVYREGVLSSDDQAPLVEGLRTLAFGEVRMRGQVARRRTIHFGWTYGYETWRVEPGPPIPEFLVGLRVLAARLAGVEREALAEVLVLDGAARWQWQHAIPPGREERYSVTFRTLRTGGGAP